jgi:hypothetical protein
MSVQEANGCEPKFQALRLRTLSPTAVSRAKHMVKHRFTFTAVVVVVRKQRRVARQRALDILSSCARGGASCISLTILACCAYSEIAHVALSQ